MYLSHLELIKQPKQLSEKASPYNYDSQKLKTDHLSSKTLVDYTFFKDNNNSRFVPQSPYLKQEKVDQLQNANKLIY